jgi:uncharacterized protein YkwD
MRAMRRGTRSGRAFALASTLAAVTVAVGCGGGGTPSNGPISESMTLQEVARAEEVLDRVNDARAAAGVEPLAWDDALSQVAYAHSADMDARDFFAHVNPDGEGLLDRLVAGGVRPAYAGETLAQGFVAPEDVVDAWLGSDGHRETLMNPRFTRMGVGLHVAPGGPWWTADLIEP